MKPIRCIECYKQRPGGRCDICPLAKKNRHLYRPIGNGWFVLCDEEKHREQKGKAPSAQANPPNE